MSSIISKSRSLMVAIGALWAALSILSPWAASAAPAMSVEQALISYKWSWKVDSGSKKVQNAEITFARDGAGSFVGKAIHWTTDSQRTVRINNEAGKTAVIALDGTLSSFVGTAFTGRPVHGERLGEADPQPASGAAKQESDHPSSQIENFADQLPTATAWISAPLRTTMSGRVAGTIRDMEEGLKDEEAKTPQGSKASYDLACHICQALTGAISEREQTLALNKQQAGGAINEAWENQWKARMNVYLKAIGAAYTQFREAVRQSPEPEKPPKAWSTASLQFPPPPFAYSTPPPAPASAPVSSSKTTASAPSAPSSNPLDKRGAGASGSGNPLDRGAYDHKRIWVPRGWWIW